MPLEAALADRAALRKVSESALVLPPDHHWGRVKNGAGTPPVRVDEGWLAFFHGVDGQYDDAGQFSGMRYSAGIVIHDGDRPDIVRYRSPEPLVSPETPHERQGVVSNVVFPTGLDPRPDLGDRVYDVYYGMGDYSVGAARLFVGDPSTGAT